MPARIETSDRHIVPRLRSFKDAVNTGELASENIAQAPKADVRPFLENKEQTWIDCQDLSSAVDLVSASIVLGKSEEAKNAANYILSVEKLASITAIKLAESLLGKPNSQAPNTIRGDLSKDVSIRQLKSKRIKQFRNSFVWAELARLYSLVGQNEKALTSMRVALGLSPHERYVVRSACRLLLHCQKQDEALHLIRLAARHRLDPWFIAAEIAVSSLLNKSPSLALLGRDILKEQRIHPFHISELACALGCLEQINGNDRRAKKLFKSSITSPTDNTLAQIVWASKRTNVGDICSNLFELNYGSEARTLDSFNKFDWDKTMHSVSEWINDEGFSARPHQLASFVTETFLDRYDLSEAHAKQGLTTNPGHPGLINNLAFAQISSGKPMEALQNVRKTDTTLLTPSTKICLMATIGYGMFRLGRTEEGKRAFELAIENASKLNEKELEISAKLYLAHELAIADNSSGIKTFEQAVSTALKYDKSYIKHIANHMSNKQSNTDFVNTVKLSIKQNALIANQSNEDWRDLIPK